MTIQRSWGPQINIGVNPPIGHRHRPLTLGVASPPPYISGVNENPDAGPETSFAGFMLRDFRIFSSPDGNIGLIPGGYPMQDYGFLMSAMGLVADFAPSPSDIDNIAEAQRTYDMTPVLMRVDADGSRGIRILRAPHRCPGFRNHVIPPGALQIDEAPRYHGYGTSRALQAWIGNGIGRCLALHATSRAPDRITIHGWDVYGFPISEVVETGAHGAAYTRRGFKWVLSVIPQSGSEGTLSVGTSHVFEFPLRADAFCDVLIWWNNHLITSPAGFTPADARFPLLPEHGSPRGTYEVQGGFNGNGGGRLQIRQAVRAVNSDTVFGTFGPPPLHDRDEFFEDSREGGPGLGDSGSGDYP